MPFIETSPSNNKLLSLSSVRGSLFAARMLFAKGPCLKSIDTVLMRWRPRSASNVNYFDMRGRVINTSTAAFHHPIWPSAAPGRYSLSLVINSVELREMSASFLLSM